MADAATNDAGTATDKAAADGDTTTDSTTDTADGSQPDAESEKWKAMARKHEREAKKAQAELERVQQSSMSEQEKAIAEARSAARAEAFTEAQRDRLRDKVELAAASKLADPSDAPMLIGDLDRFIVSGEIDTRAISAAIDDLIKTKPYLGKSPGSGSGEGGPRGGSSSTALNGDPLVRDLERKLGAPR